jgi:hypothetical protein
MIVIIIWFDRKDFINLNQMNEIFIHLHYQIFLSEQLVHLVNHS